MNADINNPQNYLLKNGKLISSPFHDLEPGDPFGNSRIKRKISKEKIERIRILKNSQIKQYNKLMNKLNRERSKLMDLNIAYIGTEILEDLEPKIKDQRDLIKRSKYLSKREDQLDQAAEDLKGIRKDQEETLEEFTHQIIN